MRWIGILGIAVFLGLAYAGSADRRAVRFRQVFWGLGLQVAIAFLLLKIPVFRDGFNRFAAGVQWVMSFADRGAERILGNLVHDRLPVTGAGATGAGATPAFAELGGAILLKIMPTLIFASALMSVLYHLGVLQRVVQAMAWLMERTMKVSGAEALSSAANVFLGMTEAPLLIRPYLPTMTSSELLAVMVGGFATISGSMMVVYDALFNVGFDQLLMASIISAPAGLYLTKLALPEKEVPVTLGQVRLTFERDTQNVLDAAAGGASTGLTLALNVGAMLLAFAAGVALLDSALEWLGVLFGYGPGLSLGRILGWVFSPVAVLMGVRPSESGVVGELLGTKVALNEYFAYSALAKAPELSDRSRLIATYALCGFANLGSIAVQLGGIGGLVPGRRRDLARFGLKAMLLGALANLTTGTLVGIFQAE